MCGAPVARRRRSRRDERRIRRAECWDAEVPMRHRCEVAAAWPIRRRVRPGSLLCDMFVSFARGSWNVLVRTRDVGAEAASLLLRCQTCRPLLLVLLWSCVSSMHTDGTTMPCPQAVAAVVAFDAACAVVMRFSRDAPRWLGHPGQVAVVVAVCARAEQVLQLAQSQSQHRLHALALVTAAAQALLPWAAAGAVGALFMYRVCDDDHSCSCGDADREEDESARWLMTEDLVTEVEEFLATIQANGDLDRIRGGCPGDESETMPVDLCASSEDHRCGDEAISVDSDTPQQPCRGHCCGTAAVDPSRGGPRRNDPPVGNPPVAADPVMPPPAPAVRTPAPALPSPGAAVQTPAPTASTPDPAVPISELAARAGMAERAAFEECDADLDALCPGGSLNEPATYESVKTQLLHGAHQMREVIVGNNRARLAKRETAMREPRWYDGNGDDADWWKSIPSRNEHGGLGTGKVFLTFVRAYLVMLQSEAALPEETPAGGRGPDVPDEAAAPEPADAREVAARRRATMHEVSDVEYAADAPEAVRIRHEAAERRAAMRTPVGRGAQARRTIATLRAPQNRDTYGRPTLGAIIETFADCTGSMFFKTLCLLNWAGHLGAFKTLMTYKFAHVQATSLFWGTQAEGDVAKEDSMAKTDLYKRHKVYLRSFAMQLKAAGGLTPVKPTPLQEADLRCCSESAQCGSVTTLYGKVIAYIKFLHGVRNTSMCDWRWKHFRFVVSRFYCAQSKSEELAYAIVGGLSWAPPPPPQCCW
eukprot:jgi/Ulvmu1/6030/UM027_0004.1